MPIPAGITFDGEADDDDDAAAAATMEAKEGEVTGGEGAEKTGPAAAAAAADHPPPSRAPTGALTPSTSSAVVIYNPGVVVDPIFYHAADYVVAFENASAQWTSPAVAQALGRLPPPLRQRSIPVAHSAGGGAVEAAQLSRRAAALGCLGLFVTTRHGYTEWCGSWPEFVSEMARRTMI